MQCLAQQSEFKSELKKREREKSRKESKKLIMRVEGPVRGSDPRQSFEPTSRVGLKKHRHCPDGKLPWLPFHSLMGFFIPPVLDKQLGLGVADVGSAG